MARRADHTREELKNLIVEAAWAIVGREGCQALSARSIATAIGYAPGTIYNLFRSMDDLYLHLNGRVLDNLYKALSSKECNDPSKPIGVNMKAMASAYTRFARNNGPYWLMLFTYRFPDSYTAPSWYSEKINLLFSPLEEILQPFFSQSQDRKRKMAARALWASVHGICFLQQTGKIPALENKNPSEEMSFFIIDMFLAGAIQKIK